MNKPDDLKSIATLLTQYAPTQIRLIRSGNYSWCLGDGCRVPVSNNSGLCPKHDGFNCVSCGKKRKMKFSGQVKCVYCKTKLTRKASNYGEGG